MIELLSLPLEHYSITSRYGMRGDSFHNGVDLIGDYDILAVNDGKVIGVRCDPKGYGTYIILEHDGFCTLYAHLSKTFVDVGQLVSAGEEIGIMGNTGVGTGRHLHFEIAQGKYEEHSFFYRHTNNYLFNRVSPEPYLDSLMLIQGITNKDLRYLSLSGIIDSPEYHQKLIDNGTLPSYDVLIALMRKIVERD